MASEVRRVARVGDAAEGDTDEYGKHYLVTDRFRRSREKIADRSLTLAVLKESPVAC